MSSLSLEAAIRTCKVDTSWANRVESERFFNPNNMVCPVWNGMDSAGRNVCPDSYVTKTAGCNSAEDRVMVENNQRPQYMEYVNLSAQGFQSDLYEDTMPWSNVGATKQKMSQVRSCPGYGGFGTQMEAQTLAPCAYSQYSQAMAQQQQNQRKIQAGQQGYGCQVKRQQSGF